MSRQAAAIGVDLAHAVGEHAVQIPVATASVIRRKTAYYYIVENWQINNILPRDPASPQRLLRSQRLATPAMFVGSYDRANLVGDPNQGSCPTAVASKRQLRLSHQRFCVLPNLRRKWTRRIPLTNSGRHLDLPPVPVGERSTHRVSRRAFTYHTVILERRATIFGIIDLGKANVRPKLAAMRGGEGYLLRPSSVRLRRTHLSSRCGEKMRIGRVVAQRERYPRPLFLACIWCLSVAAGLGNQGL